jgi:hypothetical protein
MGVILGGATGIVTRVQPFCKYNFCHRVNAPKGSDVHWMAFTPRFVTLESFEMLGPLPPASFLFLAAHEHN